MPQLYLSIGMFLWLAIDACFDGARADYERMVNLERELTGLAHPPFPDLVPIAFIIINMLAFVCFWPFVVGYKLIVLMSAPMER